MRDEWREDYANLMRYNGVIYISNNSITRAKILCQNYSNS